MNVEYWWNDTDREKPKYSEKNLSYCHFVSYKYDIPWPGIGPVLCSDRPAINCLSLGMAHLLVNSQFYFTGISGH
jgi:hypothetical protein